MGRTMMETLLNFKNLVIAAGLLAAVYTDLRTRKVPNQLLLIYGLASIIVLIVVDGGAGIASSLASIGTMIVFALPLYLLRAIGGGDFKLLFVFSVLTTWNGVMTTLLASLAWGSLLGLVQSILSGQGKQLANNVLAIAMRGKPSEQVLHKIPFTVAILFGWMTHLSLMLAGVKWI